MNIYGSDDCDSNTKSGEYAKLTYVNTRDELRVAKSGDTMTGDLSMSGNVIRGLPTNYPPHNYSGNEVPSWFQVVRLKQDAVTRVREPIDPDNAATKNYVDSRKPLITVWAEEKGALNNNHYEWSFGNGGDGDIHGATGYTMMTRGRILRMGLSASSNGSAQGTATVNVVVNGTENTAYGVTKQSGHFSGTTTFTTPLEVAQGNRINFRSATATVAITSAIVCLLIELEL